jgi:hypothetical protein
MIWEEIPAGTFDEDNPEHVQALKEFCRNKGHAAYMINQKRGRKSSDPAELTKWAQSVGPNISIENQFNRELCQFDAPEWSDYWYKWVLQIADWWRDGYLQAQVEPKRFTVDVDGMQIEVEAPWAQFAAYEAMIQLLGMHSHADRVTVTDQNQSITYIDARVDQLYTIRYVRTG